MAARVEIYLVRPDGSEVRYGTVSVLDGDLHVDAPPSIERMAAEAVPTPDGPLPPQPSVEWLEAFARRVSGSVLRGVLVEEPDV